MKLSPDCNPVEKLVVIPDRTCIDQSLSGYTVVPEDRPQLAVSLDDRYVRVIVRAFEHEVGEGYTPEEVVVLPYQT